MEDSRTLKHNTHHYSIQTCFTCGLAKFDQAGRGFLGRTTCFSGRFKAKNSGRG